MIRLVITIICASLAVAISLQERIQMSRVREGHGWLLLAQTPVEKGQLQIDFKISLVTPRKYQERLNVEIVLMREIEWKTEQQNHCSKLRGEKERAGVITLKPSAEGFASQWHAAMQLEEDYLYVVMRDCQSTLINQFFQQSAYFQITLSVITNGSHLSGWKRIMSYFVPLEVLVVFGLIYLTSRKELGQGLPEINQKLRIIQLICLLSILVSGLSYLQFISEGRNYKVLPFLSTNLMFTCLGLLMRFVNNLSNGWTISIATQTKELVTAKGLKQLTIRLIIVNIASFFRTTITEYHNPYIYIFIEYGMLWKLLKQKPEKNKTGQFNRKLMIITLFLLLIIVGIYTYSYGYLDNQNEHFKNRTFQLSSLAYLSTITIMICSQKSTYQKIALRNQSFMQ